MNEVPRQSFLMLILVIVGVILTSLVMLLTIQQRIDSAERATSASQQRDQLSANQAYIQDCIDPAGVCAKRAAANQRAIVFELLSRESALIRCSYEPTVAAYDTCSDKVLK